MFENEKLYLKKVEESDIDLYHSWRNNIDVMKTTSPFLDIYTLEDTKNFFKNVILNSQNSHGYIIVDKSREISIGIISLVNIDFKNRNCEMIIDIGNKDYWGGGYGKSSTSLILSYAFNELNMHKVYLKVFSFNDKDINLYKKLGFKEEGRNREAIYRNGLYQDIINMGLLENEYKEMN